MAENWFTYQIAPKTKVSLGSRLGLVNVESSPTQTFEQLVGRVTYAPGAKLGFNADGGVEWRQFGRGRGGDVFGVFNFSGTFLVRALRVFRGFRCRLWIEYGGHVHFAEPARWASGRGSSACLPFSFSNSVSAMPTTWSML